MKLHRISLQGIIAILFYLPLICNSLAFAERWTVESIQKEIDARGYKWKAGKTALSDFSLEELQMMFPQKLPRTIRMMPLRERAALPENLPTYLDWRNYKGGNWITPVKNQGPCGSCYAFASLGVMETLIRLYYNDPDLPVDLSEQYLVSCGPSGVRDGAKYGGCRGNWTSLTLDFLVNSGMPDEACFPYKKIQWSGIEPPCTNACSDATSRIHKLSSHSYIGSKENSFPYENEDSFIPYPGYIKAVLLDKPVACHMRFYVDWFFYTGGIYEPIPTLSKIHSWGHMVEIIGFDDEQQCWICKNSHGTNWGETADFKPYTPGAGDGGYFRVSYVTSENTLTYVGADALDMNYDGEGPSSIPTSTTTTITCPSEELYGEGSEELELLRHFRDAVLNQSPEGRELIKLYYQWSPVILKTMREDEEFKEELKNLIDGVLPLISEEIQ